MNSLANRCPSRFLAIGLLAGMIAIGANASTSLGQSEQAAKKAENPPLIDNLKSRTDSLRFEELIRRSTVESELFRRSLFETETPKIELIAKACTQFRDSEELKDFLSRDNHQGFDLSRFTLDASQIQSAISGERTIPDPFTFYGSFEGKWFGMWEKNEVDHHWGPYVVLEPATNFPIASDNQKDSIQLKGYQYVWVGDGYGINHIVSSKDGKQNYLLGYVVHLKEADPTKEVVRRPHVGVFDGPDRLIWITRSEVFFEETIRGLSPQLSSYFITGFRYSIEANKLTASEVFRTVYSRNPKNRLPWRGEAMKFSVQSVKRNSSKD